MSNKKAFVLRIDPEKLQAIEKWAADEFRSTNGQLEWIIDKVLKEASRYKKLKPENPEDIDHQPDERTSAM
ncbi:MAG: Arc family DNA binding domain-containing protein [Bacteroidia bacterium]|nr:Arc family DNA binding domain-containing protein [Bacteroidia bacterium]